MQTNLGYTRSMFLHLPHPPVHTLEAPLVGDIIDQEDALGSSRVTPDDGAEPALTRGVPDLKLHSLAVYQDSGCLVS